MSGEGRSLLCRECDPEGDVGSAIAHFVGRRAIAQTGTIIRRR